MIDGGIVALPGAIDDVRFNPDRKVTQPMLRAAGAVRWGPAVLASFTNTVIYPPFFYLASAAAILAGERAGWSVLHTLIAARILNAMTCVVASAAAIVLAGAASPLLFNRADAAHDAFAVRVRFPGRTDAGDRSTRAGLPCSGSPAGRASKPSDWLGADAVPGAPLRRASALPAGRPPAAPARRARGVAAGRQYGRDPRRHPQPGR